MADVQDAATEPSMEDILASIRKIIADDTPPVPEPEPVAEPVAAAPAAAIEDVLELTQMVQDDGSVVDLAAAAPPPPPAPAPSYTPPPAPVPAEPRPSMVSDRTASAASSSLAALASVVSVERMAASMPTATFLGNGARTLEDMTLELLRPILKEWLDQNLPPIVERMVQKEIQRITARGEG